MSGIEILIIIAFVAAALCVRFGVPLGVCWLIGKVDRHFIHPLS